MTTEADFEWPKQPKTPGVDHRVVVDQRDLLAIELATAQLLDGLSDVLWTLTGVSTPDHAVKAVAAARSKLEALGVDRRAR